MVRQEARDPRGVLERGRKVMRTSPAELSPGDTPAVVPADAPVPRPGDRRHDIEPGPPRTSRPASTRYPSWTPAAR